MFFFGTNKINSVNVEEAFEKSKSSDTVLVDVREVSEYRDLHAEGAINMPLSGLDSKEADKLKKYQTVYVICQSGGRSMRAAAFLKENSIDAVNVLGGTSMWVAKKLPTK